MNSSFSKNLTSSMGISLGGLEVVTDFLFTNPEFYESDLIDVKNNVFGQNVTKQSYEKPVRPKKTKEAIMHKFSILQCTPVIQKDEVIESPTLVGDDTDFDFDFAEEKPVSIETIEDDSEILEANSLMQRLASIGNISESIIDSTDSDSEDYIADEIDTDIEDDIDDSIDEDTELDFEDDVDSEFDIDVDMEDDTDTSFENESFNEDELQIIDDFENDFTPSTINESSDSIDNEIEDIEDDLEFEDDFSDTDGIGDLDFEDSSDEVELDFEDDVDIEEKPVVNTYTSSSDTGVNNTTHSSEDIKQMQQRFAEMEKQLHELKNAATKEQASNIRDNVNKVSDTDDIDKLLDSSKKSKLPNGNDRHAQYSLMSVEALYNEVKTYMIRMGVKTRAVEITALNEKFGELNIRKLIQKSYLIKIGSKGVTVGR